MSVQTQTAPQKSSPTGRVVTWLFGLVSFGLLGGMLLLIAHQMLVPPPASRLLLVQDIPLPGGLSPSGKDPMDPRFLAPGVETMFDGFDFQAYDAPTHRLFIAHTGPSPDLLNQANIKFNDQDDGHVVVFDTQQDKVIARLPLPQIAGIVEAPDLHKMFAAGVDPNDNDLDTVYDIDINTLQFHAIHLIANESPDALTYDSTDHRIFVSDPGAPPSLTGPQNPDRHVENVAVIDATNDQVLTRINFGFLPLLPGEKATTDPKTNIPSYGNDVGHSDYDPTLGHVYVTTQVLANADDPNPYILPPPHTGGFVAINAATMQIDQRIVLPAYCGTPHGMAIDKAQHVAFVACTDFDSGAGLFENLIRIDLRTMTVIPADPNTLRLASAPDIVRIDSTLHLVFVACAEGVTIFDENGGFHRLGIYIVGKQTHTIAINEQAQEMYFPMDIGGRPVLRIVRYNPNGR